MTSDHCHIRLEMLSQPRYLAGVRALVAAVAERYGFDQGVAGQIALAVDEALSNVIRHGYQLQPEEKIWLTIQPVCADDAVTAMQITIEDQAPQVDLAMIKSRDLDDIRPGGLGVHLIQNLMDKAVWEQREQGGMRLTMVKSREASDCATQNRRTRKGEQA